MCIYKNIYEIHIYIWHTFIHTYQRGVCMMCAKKKRIGTPNRKSSCPWQNALVSESARSTIWKFYRTDCKSVKWNKILRLITIWIIRWNKNFLWFLETQFEAPGFPFLAWGVCRYNLIHGSTSSHHSMVTSGPQKISKRIPWRGHQNHEIWPLLVIFGGFPARWEYPQARWMVFVRENPIKNWMMTGGSPILENIQIVLYGCMIGISIIPLRFSINHGIQNFHRKNSIQITIVPIIVLGG